MRMASKGSVVWVLVAVWTWLQCVESEYTAKDAVVILTEANFEKEVLQSPDYWLVEFYAPWCGHCKKLEPQYKAAAKKLKNIARLGVVDATAEQTLAQKYNIQGYPTIKEFGENKKKPTDYPGGRTKKEIISYVKNSEVAKKLGASGVSITTLDLDSIFPFMKLDESLPIAVFFGRKKAGARKTSSAPPSWLGAIGKQFIQEGKKKKSLIRIAFVPGSEEKIAAQLGIADKLPALVVIDPKASKFVVADISGLKQESATKFLKTTLKEESSARDSWTDLPSFPRPAVSRKTPRTQLKDLTAESLSKCIQKKGKLCVIVSMPKDDQDVTAGKTAELAKRYRRDPMLFFAADRDAAVLQKLTSFLDVPQDSSVVVFKPGRKLKYAQSKDPKDLNSFVDRLVEGTVHFAVVPKGTEGVIAAIKSDDIKRAEESEPSTTHEEL